MSIKQKDRLDAWARRLELAIHQLDDIRSAIPGRLSDALEAELALIEDDIAVVRSKLNRALEEVEIKLHEMEDA